MEKFIDSVEKLNLGKKIGGGSCSEIFEMNPGIYFKKFCEDYADLNDPINIEFLETIRTISEIEFLPYIVRANDIYRSRTELFGYSMNAVVAEGLDAVSDDALVSDIMFGFEMLKPSVRKLADNYVNTEDIGGDNILFNGYMYLLDLDLSLVDKRYVPDELYDAIRRKVFKAIFKKMINATFNGLVLNDDYSGYVDALMSVCSDEAGFETKTIGDVKKVYQKINKRTTVC